MHLLVRGFIHYLKYVLGFGEILLAVRMLLRFLIANPQTIIVELLYRLTDIIATPFQGIFRDLVLSNGSVVDLSALSAMIGYPVIIYLFIALCELIMKEKTPGIS